MLTSLVTSKKTNIPKRHVIKTIRVWGSCTLLFCLIIYFFCFLGYSDYMLLVFSYHLVKDGDIVDCVDIYKQPAFDHPLLKNHTIQVLFTLYPLDNSNSILVFIYFF
ncbi:putative neprosin activation peptide [Helianthus annuus]|nr:putative neprosin activation peptide [Helianthus annuus]KAJ0696866.1 putative neprosin activation peptide [Helianthus annuus]